MNDYTNFNGYSHGDMRRMVQSMDSGGVMSASDPWRKAAATLKQIRTALNTASGDATSSWEGATSDAFYAKMTKLANSVNNVAAYANDAAITMQMMSEAIDQAKRDMPEEPGFWDKVGDAVTDSAKSSVGADDEDTKTTVTDEKKAQAVAVMQTLATKYRAATSFLKPPPLGSPIENVEDIPAPGDPSGAAAIGGLIMGGGMGLAGSNGGAGKTSTAPRSSGSATSRSPQSPKPTTPPPTDSGIKGGTANPVPKPQSPGTPGPGTGIDGVGIGTKPGGTGGGSLGLGGTGGGSGAGAGGVGSGGHPGGTGGGGFGTGGGNLAGGSAKSGATGAVGAAGRGGPASGGASGAGTTKSGNAFGAGGMQGAGGGAGAGGKGGAGGRSGPSLVRRSGGVVGEAGHGGSRGRAFTEGGSGLGRGRGQSGQGPGGQGHGMPGGAQANKKDKKKGGERPDYLVEDEETWVSGDKANPTVVE